MLNKNFTERQIIDLNSKISYEQIISLLDKKFTSEQINDLNCRISYDQIISLLNKGFTPEQIDKLHIQPNGSSFTPRQIDNLKKRFTQEEIDKWDYIKSYDEIIKIKKKSRPSNRIIEKVVTGFIQENASSFTIEQISELERISFTPAQIDNLEYRISYNQIKFFLSRKFTSAQIDNLINVDFTPVQINDLSNKTFTPEQIDNLINVNFTYEQILKLTPNLLNTSYNVEGLFGLSANENNDLILNKKIGLYITLGLLNAGYPYSKIIGLLDKGLDITKLNTKQMLSYATYEKFNKANITDEQIAQMLNFGLNQSLNVFTEGLPESYNPCIFKNIFDILDINKFDKEGKNNAFTPQQLIYMLINGYSLLNILNWRDLFNLKLSNTISTNTITYNQYNKLINLGYPKPSQSSVIIILMNNGLSNTIADNTITYANYQYLTTIKNNSNIICSILTLIRLMNAGLTSSASILTDNTLVSTNIIDNMMYIIDKFNKNPTKIFADKEIVEFINSGLGLDLILNRIDTVSYAKITKLLSIQIDYKDKDTLRSYIYSISYGKIVDLMINGKTLDNISLSDIDLSIKDGKLFFNTVNEVNKIQSNNIVKTNSDIVTLSGRQELKDTKLLTLFN